MLLNDDQIIELQKALDFRQGEEPGDVLARNVLFLQKNDKAYAQVYGGLARIRDHMRQQPGHTPEKEKDLQEAMRLSVFLHKSNKRRAEMAINELVPGSFPLPEDPPTESMDLDCGDAKAAANSICVVSTPYWELGWPAGVCIAAQIGAAIACA